MADQRYGRLLTLVTQDMVSQDQSDLWYISTFAVLGSTIDAYAEVLAALVSKLEEVGILKERLEQAEAGLAERQRLLQQAKESADAALKQRGERERASQQEILKYVT